MNSREPLKIPIEALGLEDISSSTDAPAGTRLFGQVQIAGVGFHVEAWEIEEDENGEQSVVDVCFEQEFAGLFEAANPDGGFQTVEINGRDYVLFISPHGT